MTVLRLHQTPRKIKRMWQGVTVKTPPAASTYPVSVADLKARLRVDHADEDSVIEDCLKAAIAMIDGPDGIGCAMITQTWTKAFDAFASEMLLPGAPVVSVSEIRYVDSDGVSQTLAGGSWRLTIGREPVRLTPAYGTSWPSTRAVTGAVEVDYLLGTAAANVDPGLVTAVTLIAANFYENRTAVVTGTIATELPLGVQYILNRHRRGVVAA